MGEQYMSIERLIELYAVRGTSAYILWYGILSAVQGISGARYATAHDSQLVGARQPIEAARCNRTAADSVCACVDRPAAVRAAVRRVATHGHDDTEHGCFTAA